MYSLFPRYILQPGKSFVWFMQRNDNSMKWALPFSSKVGLNKEQYISANNKKLTEFDISDASAKENLGQSSYLKTFRTEKQNPADHTVEDLNLFYTIPPEHYKRMVSETFNTKAFSKKDQQLIKTFNESCAIVRKPGLEVVNYLKSIEKTAAVNRYLFYGKSGCGKSMALQYAVHYCMNENWLIVPSYYLWSWIRYRNRYKEHQKQEILQSLYNKDRVDQPDAALRWLETFRLINLSLLEQIYTTKKYVWSKHEFTNAGASIASLVEHGIARPRNAPDVIGCIMKEVREQDHTTMPPALVVVDCVNALFGITMLKLHQGLFLKPDELSFMYHLKKLISNTWKNGAVVAALDAQGIPSNTKRMPKISSDNPLDMLGREGFDWFDPHIPIHVPTFNDQEVLTLLAYYKDRKWLTGRSLTAQAEHEIIQLCENHPGELISLCRGLY